MAIQSTLPQQFNFSPKWKGTTFYGFEFELENDVTGQPIDITGATVIMQLRNAAGNLVFTFKTGVQLTATTAPLTINGPLGLISSVKIQKFNLAKGDYKYDVLIKKSNGDRMAPLTGTISVKQNVSDLA